MAMNSGNIVKEIGNHFSKHDSNFGNWFVGVTSTPEVSLFDEHNVNRERDIWIYREAAESKVAQNARKILMKKGMRSGENSVGSQSKYVYAYKRRSHTNDQ